jgi:adenosylcobinamide-phosphate synthase
MAWLAAQMASLWAWVPWLSAPLAIGVALAIDRCLGEPPLWAHPVVGMGRYLGWTGPALTRLSPALAFLGGVLAWLLGALLVVALAVAADTLVATIAEPVVRGVVLGAALKPMLSWRMLRDEVAAVEQALGVSLHAGRAQLKSLVSRDVRELDEPAVRESVIESLAENLNDSLVAPLFWFAVAGLPGAALYRFANTADAMWGYRGPYEWAGKWAARVDDALSWLPARLTAGLLCLAAGRWPDFRHLRQQATLTPSPNGGWPMGTMAWLLGVCLRKPGVYVLNGQAAPPQARHTTRAMQWAGRAVGAAALLAIGLGWALAWARACLPGGQA